MSALQCPACRHPNAAAALRCAACGLDLAAAAAVPPPPPLASLGAIWFDELPAVAEEEPLALTLRDVGAAPAVATPVAPARGLEERVAPDSKPPPPPAASLPARSATDKTAHRAAVRRERLRAPGAVPTPTGPSDVLVVDPDADAREALTTLLRGFGFVVHPQPDPATAAAWAHRRPQLTAAFLDLPLDPARAEATLALCKSIRGRDRLNNDGALPAVLVLVANQLRPVDRVRAELAGCDATITKPLTRGSVAGVLDARGVALPTDARRR